MESAPTDGRRTRRGTGDQRRRALGRPVRGGPVARARGAVAVDALRLAAGALRPRRLAGARPRAARAPGCSPTTSSPSCSRGLDALGRAVRRRRRCCPRPADEDVHGALERLPDRARSAPSSAAGCAPAAVAQRPDRHAVPAVPARPRPRRRRPASLDLVDALADQAEAHLGARRCPGRTHLQHAQPVLLAHHLLAHAWPLLRDVDRLRDWDARVAADSPYGSGALAGSSLGLDPEAVAARARLHRLDAPTRSTAPPSRDFVAEFAFVAAMIGVDLSPARRGGHPLGDRGVRLRDAARRLLDRVERSCRRRRTPTSPSWPAARPAG